ncbi:UPF0488 protein CG14286 [Condylostylus longicornis]|uniref:UPF0488 protein CG14286 n=1 Tax=Condylostylus longicornis TaxID=2530218 RepID=UPI00244E50AF|nr:UPF0488 protein CG14286 [Condylostylus longicornis]
MPVPPKAKLYNKTGKLKIIGQNKSHNNVTNNNGAVEVQDNVAGSSRDSEADCQFELELCWCIQQLENSLSSGKLNDKQIQATEKTIKTLKSSTQPVIKKRQLMRSTFGDYRAKMNEEEKKYSLGTKQIKFDPKVKQKDKSFFIKKSIFMKTGDKDFKFNFQVTQGIQDLNISKQSEVGAAEEKDVEKDQNIFHFIPSENTFKFDFKFE